MTALRSSTLEREGEPALNGVGASRVLRLVGPPIREQVTVFERPDRFAYVMLSGAPVQTHEATVKLTRQGSQTELTWEVESIPSTPVPAAVWKAPVRQVIAQLLKGVVEESQRRAETG